MISVLPSVGLFWRREGRDLNREGQDMASKILHNDMLLEIFQHLDSVKDLANCELVCSGWRKTIVQGNPWKKLYLKKVGI